MRFRQGDRGQVLVPSALCVPDAFGSGVLSIGLIGPTDARREPIAAALASLHGAATREFSAYPDL
ncbi:MAG: hypothetical protein ABSG84_17425, partial [Acidobacteriaceae bacterium]